VSEHSIVFFHINWLLFTAVRVVAGRWALRDGRHALEDELRPRFTALMRQLAPADGS
jgi:TRAP-type mannitol/chloroaromatic compound transport system permease small subunit